MQNRITEEINYMVEHMPEEEQKLVLEIVRRFVPDDVATPEDIEAIHAAEEDARLGLLVKHEDIDWNAEPED